MADKIPDLPDQNPPQGGCEIEQPPGYYCSRDFHHNGPCALHPHYAPAPYMPVSGLPGAPIAEHTGGPVSYYLVAVTNPNQGSTAYMAECGDIIEALGMNFNEGNAFKAIWRSAAARTLKKLKHAGDPVYDAEKVVFYGQRMLATLTGKKVK